MPAIKFQSVEEFWDYLPEDEKLLVLILRELILECIPDGCEKLSYNVPYYFRNKRVVFIWPASVPGGKVPPKGVTLGFCQGHLLKDEDGYLEKGKRKQVYTKTFFRPEEIDFDLLRAYLDEAVAVDSNQ
jgi:hypothetical protein